MWFCSRHWSQWCQSGSWQSLRATPTNAKQKTRYRKTWPRFWQPVSLESKMKERQWAECGSDNTWKWKRREHKKQKDHVWLPTSTADARDTGQADHHFTASSETKKSRVFFGEQAYNAGPRVQEHGVTTRPLPFPWLLLKSTGFL